MNTLLNFLAANDFEKKTFTLPEEAFESNLDDSARDYYSELAEFENHDYYLLNNIDCEGQMETELEKLYNQFKINAFQKKLKEDQEFKTDVTQQMDKIVQAIKTGIHEARGLQSKKLEALFNKKLSYAQKTIEFIKDDSNESHSHIGTAVYYSYEWLREYQIPISKAFNIMIGKWISPDTQFKDFRAVFSKKPIEECRPIMWYEHHINGLVLFIVRLKEQRVINDGYNPKKLNIQLLKKCFITPSGEPFTHTSVKNTKNRMIKEMAQPKKDAINDLIKKIIE